MHLGDAPHDRPAGPAACGIVPQGAIEPFTQAGQASLVEARAAVVDREHDARGVGRRRDLHARPVRAVADRVVEQVACHRESAVIAMIRGAAYRSLEMLLTPARALGDRDDDDMARPAAALAGVGGAQVTFPRAAW
jgi:hypothetical protein